MLNTHTVKRNCMPTETDWAYFAGLIDGEAYIDIFLRQNPTDVKTRRGYAREFKLQVAGSSRKLLEQVQENIGSLGKITTHRRDKEEQEKGWNEYYTLRFSHNQQRMILPKIMPYLILKKPLANIVLRALNIISTIPQSKEREHMLLNLSIELNQARQIPGLKHRKRRQDSIIEEYLKKTAK
jgi:hypothetical protein